MPAASKRIRLRAHRVRRMFGTFAEAPQDEPLRFGLGGAAPATETLLKIMFGVWVEILADAFRAESVTAKLQSLFGRPV
jgi:hypothetical protein